MTEISVNGRECLVMRCLTLFVQAAEQAKASPALVAKDPATSTNKKEEEDLAKGGHKSVMLKSATNFLEEREVISLSVSLSQRSNCLWRTSGSSLRSLCLASTRAPAASSPLTRLRAERSGPSMTLRQPRTMSSPLNQARSSPSWMTGVHWWSQWMVQAVFDIIPFSSIWMGLVFFYMGKIHISQT